jgi:ribosomal protein S6
VEKTKLYEAMFLVDSALGGSEFGGVVEEIVGLIKRHEGEVRQIQKWGDRKLAYTIGGLKRGLYVLVHFEAPPARIAPLRRDIYLRDRLVRVLILRVADVPEPVGDLYNEAGEQIEKPVEETAEGPAEPAEAAEKSAEEPAEEKSVEQAPEETAEAESEKPAEEPAPAAEEPAEEAETEAKEGADSGESE